MPKCRANSPLTRFLLILLLLLSAVCSRAAVTNSLVVPPVMQIIMCRKDVDLIRSLPGLISSPNLSIANCMALPRRCRMPLFRV